jgi:hypothetical protein
MNKIIDIQADINKLMMNSQQFSDRIAGIKDVDPSTNFYLNNLKRLSFQALDLCNAMNRQMSFLNNQKKFLAIRDGIKRRSKRSI